MIERGPDRRQGDDRREAIAGDPFDEGPPFVTCPHCGHSVPGGDFCGQCGAHLTAGNARRTNAFAAVPNQRVAHLAIVSTLFPHLPHRRGGPFRVALIAGSALVVMLAGLHLFAPATVAAVLILPVLYLMYLYEVEIYEREPWLVVGATMVMGVLLGLAFTNLTGPSLSRLVLTGDRESALVLAGLTVPIVGQALMLAGPLFLYLFRSSFDEPLDGLTFGAASAFGFTLASSLTEFWPLLSGPLVGTGSPLDWGLRLARVGLLVALVNACTTGVIAAAVWLHRYDRRPDRPWTSSILACVLIAFVAQVVLGVLGFVTPALVADVVIVAIVAAALLLYVRVVIHDALLAEGAQHGGRAEGAVPTEIGPEAPCPECHRMVPTMRFCPSCGAARSAAPKQSRPRIARSRP